MTPKDFCNWFQGVLDMAEEEDGAAHFEAHQVKRMKERLAEALREEKDDPLSGRPPGARCTLSADHQPGRSLRIV